MLGDAFDLGSFFRWPLHGGGMPETDWGSGLRRHIYEANLFMEASRPAAQSQGLGKRLGFWVLEPGSDYMPTK